MDIGAALEGLLWFNDSLGVPADSNRATNEVRQPVSMMEVLPVIGPPGQSHQSKWTCFPSGLFVATVLPGAASLTAWKPALTQAW